MWLATVYTCICASMSWYNVNMQKYYMLMHMLKLCANIYHCRHNWSPLCWTDWLFLFFKKNHINCMYQHNRGVYICCVQRTYKHTSWTSWIELNKPQNSSHNTYTHVYIHVHVSVQTPTTRKDYIHHKTDYKKKKQRLACGIGRNQHR